MAAAGAESMGLLHHLPALQVVVPMIAAPICVLIGNRYLAWWVALAASVLAFLASAVLLGQVYEGGSISYHLGGWEPPLGIEYRIDAANGLLLFLIAGISSLVLLFARDSVAAEISPGKQTLFYCCFLLCLTGLLGVVITGDAFNVFVFLEISSLSTYALIAMGGGRDKRAYTASFDYLIMGTIGATFFVIGIGMLYMATGTLNMADLSDRLTGLEDSRTVRAAFAFIVVGMGLKVAIYPLHLWLPNAYTFAPSAVTAFLAATATKAAIYVLLRFMFSIFKPGFVFEVDTLNFVILPFAVLAMFAASAVAVFQSDLKRLLAYSSIAQIGYMLLGLSLITKTGLAASIVHLFNHGITKGALFMVVGAYVLRTGSSFLNRLNGMGKLMPITSAAFVVAGLSLIGVPGTAGFVSKWVLMQAALEIGWWPVALAIVASSLLAVVYVWRTVEILYMKAPDPTLKAAEAPPLMLIAMWVLALSCIYFGLHTGVTMTAANSAAESLMLGSGRIE